MNNKDIKNLAFLARLDIKESEADKLSADLSDILSAVEQHAELDLDGVEPLAHPLDILQRLRSDKVTETDNRERFQTVAPRTRDGYYLVPKVIE